MFLEIRLYNSDYQLNRLLLPEEIIYKPPKHSKFSIFFILLQNQLTGERIEIHFQMAGVLKDSFQLPRQALLIMTRDSSAKDTRWTRLVVVVKNLVKVHRSGCL